MDENSFIIFLMNQLSKNGHNHIDDLEALTTAPQYSQYEVMKLLQKVDARLKRYLAKQLNNQIHV